MSDKKTPDKTSYGTRQADFYSVCKTCPFGCCREARPPLTANRRELIQDFLRVKDLGLPDPFEFQEYVFPRETREGYCIFLNETTNKCIIQPVKPETCVAGPITFDININEGKIEWFLKTEKICPLASFVYKDKESFERHLKSAKLEILNLVRDLDGRALHKILTIKEPDTFKISADNLDPKVVAKLRQ
jgi:Fe-S-cluster containining protein